MTFAEYRAHHGLTLEQCAVALGLSPSSQSWLSEIESGKRDASLRLALRIESWTGGQVTAASVCKEVAKLRGGPAAPSQAVAP